MSPLVNYQTTKSTHPRPTNNYTDRHALPIHHPRPPRRNDLSPSPRSTPHIRRHRTSLVCRRVRCKLIYRNRPSHAHLNSSSTTNQPPNQPRANDPTHQASIHALHNPRSASPAWPLAARSAEAEPSSSFAESYDAVTQEGLGKRNNTALMAKIRDCATRLLKSKGESQMIAEKQRSEEDEAPVLRPRKVVYRFSA